MRGTKTILAAISVVAGLTACVSSADRQPAATQPGQLLNANLGDTVIDSRTILPDMLLGSTETGRVIVRFTGTQGRQAVFVREHLVLSNRYDSALWTPVGVPASQIAGYTTATQPISLALLPGEVMPVDGRRLTVRRVQRNALEYTLE